MTDQRTKVDDEKKEPDNEGSTPTIAVTGAAGYIGSRVLVELRAAHP